MQSPPGLPGGSGQGGLCAIKISVSTTVTFIIIIYCSIAFIFCNYLQFYCICYTLNYFIAILHFKFLLATLGDPCSGWKGKK